jgi:hypothetical protein
LLALAVLFLPLVSAVTLSSGTILNTSVSNSSMTFVGCSLNVTSFTITSTSIILLNPIYNSAGFYYTLPSSITYTAPNSNIDCGELGTIYGKEYSKNLHDICGKIFDFNLMTIGFITLFFIAFIFIIIVGIVFYSIYGQKGENDSNSFSIITLFIVLLIISIIITVSVIFINNLCLLG